MPKQRSFATALKWSYVANWGQRGSSALFTFILAGLLGPREFGIVSMAMIYIAFINMFLDQGLAAALIQRKDLEPDHSNAVFWMDMALGLLLAIVSVVLSGWWARVNHQLELTRVIATLSLCIPIEGFSVVQKALLQRELDFKSLSLRSNASVLVGGVVGISMAVRGYGIWALVGAQLSRDLSAAIVLWASSDWRPHFGFSFRHFKELLGFSTSHFTAQLANFVDNSTDTFLMGMFFGPTAVGLYRLADRFKSTVLATATSSLQAVALPEFSRVQDDPEKLRRSVQSCIRLSSVITLPAMVGLAMVSTPLMAAVGPEWAMASSVLKILCLSGMGVMFVFFTGPLLQALSKPHYMAGLEWARTAVGLGCTVFATFLLRHSGLANQIIGIAVATLVGRTLLIVPFYVYILIRFSRVSFEEFISNVTPSLLAAITVAIAMFALSRTGILGSLKPTNVLLLDVIVGGQVAIATVLIFDRSLRQRARKWMGQFAGFGLP